MEKSVELNHLVLSESNLTRVISWAVAADQKAGIILTFVLFSSGYLFSQSNEGLKLFFSLIKRPENLNILLSYVSVTLLILLFCSSGFFLFWAGFHLVSALRPRVAPHSAKKSLFFFGSISQMPCDEFTEEFSGLDHGKTLKAICDQTFNVSKVISAKYQHISDSIWWFQYGILLLAGFSLLCQLMTQILSK